MCDGLSAQNASLGVYARLEPVGAGLARNGVTARNNRGVGLAIFAHDALLSGNGLARLSQLAALSGRDNFLDSVVFGIVFVHPYVVAVASLCVAQAVFIQPV